MATGDDTRAALALITSAAVGQARGLLRAVSGSPEVRRAGLLEGAPELIGYFTDGTSALAADSYEDQRELANASGRFMAEPIVLDRTVKIRRGVAWASEPLFDGDELTAGSRLAEVVQLETARPYRDTILTNQQRDVEAVGWRRVTRGSGCRFCRMLADRGAVYMRDSATFAAHPNCSCTAVPVFRGGEVGPEASAIQYIGSRRSQTPATRARLNEYLNSFYPNE